MLGTKSRKFDIYKTSGVTPLQKYSFSFLQSRKISMEPVSPEFKPSKKSDKMLGAVLEIAEPKTAHTLLQTT